MLSLHMAFRVRVNNYPLILSPLFGRTLSGPILAEVAAKYGVDVRDLKGPSRERRYAWPRQEAMSQLRRRTKLSLPQIGSILGGRDHTTVIHGIRQHERREAAA